MNLDQIDNCIFDLDDTLINTSKAFFAYRRMLKDQLQLHTGRSAHAIADALYETGKKLETQFFAARLDLIEHGEVSSCIKSLSDNVLREISESVKSAYYANLRVDESILAMLDVAAKAGKTIFMFTGGSPAHTADKLIASELWRYFKIVFTGDLHPFEDLGDSGLIDKQSIQRCARQLAPIFPLGANPKSSMHGYLSLLKHANLDARRTLMVGNHLRDDVLSAQQAGLYAAQATWFDFDVSAEVVPNLVLKEPLLLFGI